MLNGCESGHGVNGGTEDREALVYDGIELDNIINIE